MGIVAASAVAQQPVHRPGPRDHARPPAGGQGPWNNDIQVHRVKGSAAPVRLAEFPRAGVSTIARLRDGRLIAAHQNFPEGDDEAFDKVAVRFSSDEGSTWTFWRTIGLTGLPEGMRFPFDPTLVALPDGRVRMYFTSLRGRRFDQDTPAIFSAISTDGLDYDVEPGRRFGVEGRPVIDCAVVLHGGVFHLYAPDNGQGAFPVEGEAGLGYHATSRDGLLFTREADVRVVGGGRWLGCAVSDGRSIVFFGTGGSNRSPGRQPAGGLWTARSTDGRSWGEPETIPIAGADPGVVAARDGAWILTVTGPPRGTPQGAPRRDRMPRPMQ
jgi:hypothetical protein